MEKELVIATLTLNAKMDWLVVPTTVDLIGQMVMTVATHHHATPQLQLGIVANLI